MDTSVKVELVKLYYQNGSSASAALRSYKSAHGLKNDPFPPWTISRIVQHFEETGSVLDIPRPGRPSLQTSRMEVVQQALHESSSNALHISSVRHIADISGVPKSSVHAILRQKLRLYPYHLSFVQALTPDDAATRLKFASSFLETDLPHLMDILWTDEAYFHLDGEINNHNCTIWSDENPHTVVSKELYPRKLCV
jgi:hypothetical protein